MPSSFRSSLRSVSTRTATTCRIPPRTRIVNCRKLTTMLRSAGLRYLLILLKRPACYIQHCCNYKLSPCSFDMSLVTM
ncbi:hypothetical protein VIGAN_04231200 [Vigna angularis var. angularis]|uniref:Uncharacterized protein n=1 Tax=Vigna angularis var. angularis TaxID=157739 RepID=A0A0S3RWE9_PHAAN|nr:hypothetical protein VIGAN_04231200 [Vigna angularis var. angularis]